MYIVHTRNVHVRACEYEYDTYIHLHTYVAICTLTNLHLFALYICARADRSVELKYPPGLCCCGTNDPACGFFRASEDVQTGNKALSRSHGTQGAQYGLIKEYTLN